MTIKTKPSSISDFNSILDKDYQDLNKKREGWYPIMYYNEDVALENKNYITIHAHPPFSSASPPGSSGGCAAAAGASHSNSSARGSPANASGRPSSLSRERRCLGERFRRAASSSSETLGPSIYCQHMHHTHAVSGYLSLFLLILSLAVDCMRY